MFKFLKRRMFKALQTLALTYSTNSTAATFLFNLAERNEKLLRQIFDVRSSNDVLSQVLAFI